MSEDEEVLRKGSALYNYLQDNGFSNFEAYELEKQSYQLMQPVRDNNHHESKVPQWTINHLNCILKSGLILEDHRHFIEYYYPFQIQEYSSSRFKFRFRASIPLLFLSGGLWRFARTPVSKALFVASAGVCSLYTIFSIRETLRKRSMAKMLRHLQQALSNLEKLFVQFKRMLLLVSQNDFVSQNISMCHKGMQEFKEKLRDILVDALRQLLNFVSDIKRVPLSFDVDSALLSVSVEDVYSNLDFKKDEEEDCSFEILKKLFNSYILVQSELLRRLALCHCPDFWTEHTHASTIKFCQEVLPIITYWSAGLQKTLAQEQKLFRAILESKTKGNQRIGSQNLGSGYSDIYVSVRSACIHFQSLLIQTQGLQDILESGHPKDFKEFLNTAAQILLDIKKEVNFGQVCIESSLVQIYKMLGADNESAKPGKAEIDSFTPSAIDEAHADLGLHVNPPIEDEVFELTIPLDETVLSEDEEWTDICEQLKRKKKEGDTSKSVLLELKTVLVKKAEEMKEREKRALESKGIPYTAAEQVCLPSEKESLKECSTSSISEECLGFLPTGDVNDWPLARLKGSLKTHRSKRDHKVQDFKSDDQDALQLDNLNVSKSPEVPESRKVGFEASLLAEAIAKSRSMKRTGTEDVFIDSDDAESM